MILFVLSRILRPRVGGNGSASLKLLIVILIRYDSVLHFCCTQCVLFPTTK